MNKIQLNISQKILITATILETLATIVAFFVLKSQWLDKRVLIIMLAMEIINIVLLLRTGNLSWIRTVISADVLVVLTWLIILFVFYR